MMRWKIAAATMALHVVFFAAWAAREESRLLPGEGESILVRTAPVDPRDLLSGQYMRLSYEFSSPGRMTTVGPAPEVGDVVWVVVAPDSEKKFHVPRRLSGERPGEFARGEVVLRGRLAKSWLCEFGIERFFVPEGTETPNPRDVTVRLRIGKDGRPRIEQVYVKDKPWP